MNKSLSQFFSKSVLWLWKTVISLKFAVVVILLLAGAMAVATFLESIYDIPTGRYWIYQARFFYALLGMLGLLITAVALSRWPWKKKHTPFLFAHLGIILVLVGSWVTQQWGIDASLLIQEGEIGSRLESDSRILTLAQGTDFEMMPIEWQPPMVSWKPKRSEKFGVEVEKFLSHSEAKIAFSQRTPEEVQARSSQQRPTPALQVHFEIEGIGFKNTFWMWAGSPAWSYQEAGPASFVMLPEDILQSNIARGPRLEFSFRGRNREILQVRSVNTRGEVVVSQLKWGDIPRTKPVIQTNWKGPMGAPRVRLVQWLRDAKNDTSYLPARTQYGDTAPPSAILVSHQGKSIWLGEGERAEFQTDTTPISVGYGRRTLSLPFGIKLVRFTIHHDPGTRNPASYESLVQVVSRNGEEPPVTISMNEPLKWGGYTFYQSSYIPSEPRPTVSILSVNRDPGRATKYAGSLFLVLGSILLFAMKKFMKIKSAHGGKS